uniref:Uncharacterized protein LOC111110021 isoform X1 n=1 Tax=Crassostrea virginica TaxID=6565 RepID=A0A8B8BFA7_CRAVI|nr:uncharacterized protein LOC111110021 isoform X1 [Crassostrea virginica]XP_022302037.1 uncharacterized protein LOC111110021 isoform X1 [Crassostrea virginica]XP_022302039.1 uncharacterized protein LOC111110021 isoform X1 [Crassostrea virginica]
MSDPEVSPERPKSAEEKEESEGESKIKVDESSPETDTKTEDESGLSLVERSESRESERPESSQSTGRPKSSGSDTAQNLKGRRKKKMNVDPDARQVTFTITICIAVPTKKPLTKRQRRALQNSSNSTSTRPSTVEDEDVPDIKQLIKKKKQVFEAPRVQNYYHLEYYLTPEENSLQKVDVVTYGPAAIIFMASHDPRIVRTWIEGELTWVAWTHKHVVNVSNDLLLKLFTHSIELRIWDTMGKVGVKARFTKLKQFKIPNSKPGEEDQNSTKNIVVRLSKSYAKHQPKKDNEIRPIPTQVSFHSMDKVLRPVEEEKPPETKPSYETHPQAPGDDPSKGGPPGSPTPKTLVGVPNQMPDQDGRSSFSRLGRLANYDPTEEPSGKESHRSKSSSGKKEGGGPKSSTSRSHGPKSAESSGSVRKQPSVPTNQVKAPRRTKKQELAAQQAAEQIRKYGICMVPIRMAMFFSGLKNVTNRLKSPVPGIEDMFIQLKLDAPLMSDQQRKELNPMILTVKNATNLPNSPMTYEELNQKCQHVFCKYQFFKQPEHCSLGRKQRESVYWDDINVVLLGSLEPSELRQYLNGPPLEIEVHDRDRKPEGVKLKPTLFGDDLEDEKISNVGTVASRRTVHNAFKGRNKPWDPYGVAKVDLSELLQGHQFLYLKVPIHNCPVPDVFPTEEREDGRSVGVMGAVDGPVDKPYNAGHYVQSNAMLKVKVELAHPLTTPTEVAAKQPLTTTPQCPFGRIVYIFNYKNTVILNQLEVLVTEINAKALQLDDMPPHVISAALSTYKLSLEQQKSRDLDIMTGFQVMDGDKHVFVLEGLRDRAISYVWENVPAPENSDVRVLYNSDLSFSERLYGPLDVDLCRVKLHEPLSQIIQQPLLYVRDMVPKPCFQGLLNLHQVMNSNVMKDVVRNSLFPSADMVISMSREFGVPITQEDFDDLQLSKPEAVEDREGQAGETTQEAGRVWTPIDNFNPQYMEAIAGRQQRVNFIKENRDDVKVVSDKNKEVRERTKVPTIRADVTVAHNYSSQSLNSTELAKEKLRQMLAEEPDTRFTYCQEFHHSMTVVPVNVEALKKAEKAESQARWKTEKGWIYPGMKSMLECNEHPQRPNTARIEELQEKWRENFFHVGMLQAPLDRDKFPWPHRRYDMELYQRPQSCFIREPVTIHLAGQKLKEEKIAALKKDFEVWRSKVVVEDTRQYYHRCLKETELNERGRKGQNQVDKMKGLLKDKPVKFSLRKKGLGLKEVPPLNVVLNPSVDTAAREAGLPTIPAVENEGQEKTNGFKPGPYEDHSWNLERNKIPVYDYQHKQFKESKGADFNAVHTERTKLYRRTIVPLNDWERDNHLFWIPDDVSKFGPYEGIVPENKSTLPPVENPNVAVSSVIAQSLSPNGQKSASGLVKSFNAKEAMVS